MTQQRDSAGVESSTADATARKELLNPQTKSSTALPKVLRLASAFIAPTRVFTQAATADIEPDGGFMAACDPGCFWLFFLLPFA